MIPEREREALMRLTMCAREECIMCEYHKECDFDFQYELATESMNILAEALRKTEPITHDDYIESGNDYLEARCLNCNNAKACKEKHWSGCIYEPIEDEPQTCSVNGRPYDCGKCEYFRCTADEPQTETQNSNKNSNVISVYDGVSEAVRCAMCSNPNKSNRGCDGACSYDEKLYKRIMDAIDKSRVDTPQTEREGE